MSAPFVLHSPMAVVLKTSGLPIGSVGLFITFDPALPVPDSFWMALTNAAKEPVAWLRLAVVEPDLRASMSEAVLEVAEVRLEAPPCPYPAGSVSGVLWPRWAVSEGLLADFASSRQAHRVMQSDAPASGAGCPHAA